jgi:hypothetical protein
MPDCSKTAEFLAAWNRMHKAAKGACGICPMKDVCEDVGRIKEKGQTIVQKWADDHPAPIQKTYADDFFAKFPNARKVYYPDATIPSVKRCDVYGTLCFHAFDCCDDSSMIKCWDEPYPEQDAMNE